MGCKNDFKYLTKPPKSKSEPDNIYNRVSFTAPVVQQKQIRFSTAKNTGTDIDRTMGAHWDGGKIGSLTTAHPWKMKKLTIVWENLK